MWSWLLHRITGLGILLFLLLHIVDISMIGFGPQAYNESVALFDSVIVRLLSLALIGAVLLHAFNGLEWILQVASAIMSNQSCQLPPRRQNAEWLALRRLKAAVDANVP